VRYWLCTLGALVLAGACIVLIDNGIYHLVRTGSCGSSSTYVSSRPCPPGTAGHILGLIGGVFGALAAVGIYAARGGRGVRGATLGLGLILWSLVFVTIPASMLVAAYGPAGNNSSGARTTAIVLAAVFIPMGLAPLPFAFRGRKKQAMMRELATTGRRCPGVVESVEDTNVTINDNPRVRITVRAEPPGESPFRIVKTATVSRVRVPRPGDRCVVLYDPSNREQRNGITFDQVPGFVQPADDGDEDALEKIEKLAELRDRGILTAEEFDAQKKRLLNEV
jgi:Short C-terminal domain